MHFVAVKKSRKLSGVVIYFMSAARGGGRGGGGDTQQSYVRGGSTPSSNPALQPFSLLYTIFDKKDTPFVYLPLTNGAPVTYLV